MKTQKQLSKLLNVLDGVTNHTWSDVLDILSIFPDIIVIEKKWASEWKEDLNSYPLDLSLTSTWSTYDNKECIVLKYVIEKNKFYCYVKIYDGHIFDGKRKLLRFTAKLLLPNKFLKKISSKIEHDFNILAHEAYSNYLEVEDKKWIEDFKETFLGNL